MGYKYGSLEKLVADDGLPTSMSQKSTVNDIRAKVFLMSHCLLGGFPEFDFRTKIGVGEHPQPVGIAR